MAGEWIREAKNGGASVVFVHGILSSGEQCWQHDNGTYWPDLLKNELGFESLGIYVYSYQTDISSGSYSLSDVVDDLKVHLISLDNVVDSNTLIFVCHSMGGIVVRKFLVERVQDLLDRNIKVGLYLVASPSLGSKYANWLAPIAKLAGHAQAKALKFSQSNQWLNDLDKTFKNLKESARLIIHGRELLEDKSIILKKFLRNQVVPPVSGACYFGESIKIAGSDHCSIAKPEDNQALQHRILLDFLKKLLPEEIQSNTTQVVSPQPIFVPQVSQVDLNVDNADSIELVEQQWQTKLRSSLVEQLKRTDLSDVINNFIEELGKQCPDLPDNFDAIANYLVLEQKNDVKRIDVILILLSVAEKHANNHNLESLYYLFAYLLQTLVKQCEGAVNGLTWVPFERRETLELINAAKRTNPLVPDYDAEQLEFENGQRNSRLENIGDFQPTSGNMDPEKVCQDIAKELLQTLGDSDKNPVDAVKTLMGRLNRYRYQESESRLQGIHLHEEMLAEHPFNVTAVAERFIELTQNKLPIYVYGTRQQVKINDWLHSDEEDIRGLIVEENKIVENYNKQFKKTIKPDKGTKMDSEIKLGDIGNNATVSIVTGSQSGSQVGHANIQLSQDLITQLLKHLDQLRIDAEQTDDVGKLQYAAITQATDAIQAEIQKPEGADKSILLKSKQVFEGVKNIASISASIEKITRLLLLFI
jgi:hypothetical protein